MNATLTPAKAEMARGAIAYNAKECEDCLRLAAFADDQDCYSPGLGAALRKMATYHSDRAFEWSATLARVEGRA